MRVRDLGLILATTATLGAAAQRDRDALSFLGAAEVVSEGVTLYRLADPNLIDPPGPTTVQLLRLDPERAVLRLVLATDEVLGLETTPSMSARCGALAAVNAGFFQLSGDPAGVLKVNGALVSDMALTRGAVAIFSPLARKPATPAPGESDAGTLATACPSVWASTGRPATSSSAPTASATDDSRAVRLLFDRVTVKASVSFENAGGGRVSVALDGVDTPRARSKLILYTPEFHADTDTDEGGVEWSLAGSPPRVIERRTGAGKTPIPAQGFVLSYGGLEPPGALAGLAKGGHVRIDYVYRPELGTSVRDWERAPQVVGGAGLLRRRDRDIVDWGPERPSAGFETDRHPRTVIGVDDQGAVWLITVDGRNPDRSLGMSFAELQNLARKLRLVDALNLDGGGSTTMVVKGTIVNHPSDVTGPRRVSDALLVFPR